MRILFFLHNLDIGGAAKVLINIANLLCKSEVNVEFVLCKQGGELQDALNARIQVHCLGDIKMKGALFPLKRFIQNVNPDFIISGTDFANFIAIAACVLAKTKTKAIVTQHNMKSVEHTDYGFFRFFFPLAMKLLYPLAKNVVAVSNGVHCFLISIGVNNKNIRTIYNPIELSEIERLSCLEFTDKINNPYIIFVGRLVGVKNIYLLLRAFAILVKKMTLDLVIVGDGPEYNQLQSYVRDLNIVSKVHFLGNRPNPYPYLKHSKLCILPSFSEALPTVLIEAMALGVTCVATASVGAKEVLDNGKYGYLFDGFNDEIEFANKIEYALRYPIFPSKLKENANKYLPQFILPQYFDLLK